MHLAGSAARQSELYCSTAGRQCFYTGAFPSKEILNQGCTSLENQSALRDFPPAPGAETLHSQCRGGLGWIPGQGTRKWQPTPVFSPGKFHWQRSLVGYSPGGRKESNTTEHTHTHTHTHTQGTRSHTPQLRVRMLQPKSPAMQTEDHTYHN